MKLIKMFGLAAIAAVAAMSFVGVSSAMAVEHEVVVCTQLQSLCAAGNVVPQGGTITGTATNPILLGQTNEKCENSSVSGDITSPGGMGLNLLGEILTTSFTGNCKPCSTVTASAKVIHVTMTLPEHWVIVVLEPKATFTGCPLGVSCTFSEAAITMTGTNTATGGKIVASGAKLNRTAGSEFFCGNVGEWDAEYNVTGKFFSLFEHL